MSAYNYRTRDNPVIFILPPSPYRGRRVKILRSRNAAAVHQTGTVTIHNTERGTLQVMLDDDTTVWTHVSNVELIDESEKK